jgi:hypothetical protein
MVFVLNIFFQRGGVREITRRLGLFLVGYGAVVLIVFGYYRILMGVTDPLKAGLNPVTFLSMATKELLLSDGVSSRTSAFALSEPHNPSWHPYYQHLGQVLYLHSFLVIGLGFSLVEFGYSLLARNRQEIREHLVSNCIPYMWLVLLFIAYSYYFVTRGFFVDYFREFLPALVIVFSAWIRNAILAFEREGFLEWFILCGVCLSAVWFYVQASHKEFFGIGHHGSLTIAVFAVFSVWRFVESLSRRVTFLAIMLGLMVFIILSRQEPLKAYLSGIVPSLLMIGTMYGVARMMIKGKTRPSLTLFGRFVGQSVLLASFLVSLSISAILLDVTYASVWSPESVKKVAAYLNRHTREGDEVISGAVIWELQALRRPFQMISHPLAFEDRISEQRRQMIARAAASHPPKAIILDGYTEKTYIRHIPWLMELLGAKYEPVIDAGPARYPVMVYVLKEDLVSRDAEEGVAPVGRQAKAVRF